MEHHHPIISKIWGLGDQTYRHILGECDVKSTCSDGCIDVSDDRKNDGSLLGSMDGFTDSSNDGKADSSLLGAALSTYDGCVLEKSKGATVGSWDG